MVGLGMTEEIEIPAGDSPLDIMITLNESDLDKTAEELLKSVKYNHMFIYFTNYVISRLVHTRENIDDVDLIKDNLMNLTTLQEFEEKQTEEYRFSTIKYKKYLQNFVKKIKDSVLISTDGFSLIKPVNKSIKTKKQLTGRNIKYRVNSENSKSFRLANSVLFTEPQYNYDLYEKTIEEIMSMNVGQYPITNSNTNTAAVTSRDGWFISRFDKNEPLYDGAKLLQLFKSKANLCKVKTVGDTLTLTIDTYNYFDKLLKEAGHKGLLRAKGGQSNVSDGPVLDQDKIDDNRKDNFHITYLTENSVNLLTGDGLYLKVQEDVPFSSRKFGTAPQIRGEENEDYEKRMKNRNLETDVTEGVNNKVLSSGLFSSQNEYEFTRHDIEELRQHINNLAKREINTYAKSILLDNLKNPNTSDEKIDSLSDDRTRKGLVDLLFTPKDKKLPIGVFSSTYKINKTITGKSKEEFFGFIATNSENKKKQVSRLQEQQNEIQRRSEDKHYEKVKELLDDVSENTLDKFINSQGEFPSIFFEQLIEEVNNQHTVKIIDNNDIIDIDDTVESIQDKILEEDTESNSIIEEPYEDEEADDEDEEEDTSELLTYDSEKDEEDEEEENDESYFDKLNKLINEFKKTETDLYEEHTKSKKQSTKANLGKQRRIQIIEHTSSTFKQLAVLDATSGHRGGINSRGDSTDRLHSGKSKGKNIKSHVSTEVNMGKTTQSIKRAFNILNSAVESIK